MSQGTQSTFHKSATETIRKEEQSRRSSRATDKRSGNHRLCNAGGAMVTPRTSSDAPRVSAAVRFLEEKMGLVDHADQLVDHAHKPPTRELLYRGVSYDGRGRAEYLKERKKYNVTDRYGIPCTVSHQYGLGYGGKEVENPVTSPNCKKPIVQRSFFRTRGVATYKDLPMLL